jgi:hypothetical protein
MVALLCFILTLFTSPFKSKSRPEAESAELRHQLTVLRRTMSRPTHEERSLVFDPAASMISFGLEGRRPHSSLDGTTPDQAYFNPLPIRMAA